MDCIYQDLRALCSSENLFLPFLEFHSNQLQEVLSCTCCARYLFVANNATFEL